MVNPQPPVNPYAGSPPFDAYEETESGTLPDLCWGKLRAGDTISPAWDTYHRNVGLMVSMTIVFFVVTIAFAIAQDRLEPDGDDRIPVQQALTAACVRLLSGITSMVMTLGVIRITLAVLRGQPTSLGRLFLFRGTLRMFLASLIIGTAVGVLGLAFIIPMSAAAAGNRIMVGIAFVAAVTVPLLILRLLLSFWAFPYFIVDRNMGVIEALQMSHQHMRRNTGGALLLALICGLYLFVGVITLGIGLLVAYPMVQLMATIAYLMITGQYATGSSSSTNQIM